MTVVTGQRRTDNQASIQRFDELDAMIRRLEPEATPLVNFMGRIAERGGKKLTGDPKFKWEESEREARYDAINKSGGYEAGDTELVVDTEEVFFAGQLIKIPRTGEILRVKALKGSSKIEVSRGYSGSSAAAIVNDDPILLLGFRAEEGSRSPEARTKNPEEIYNFTEIFKDTVEISGTAHSSRNRTSPHDWVYQHQEKMREHLINIELAALFGGRGENAGTEGKIRTSGGCLQFCTQNNQDAGGTLTESELSSWLRAVTRFGNRKTVFGSRLFMEVVNNFAVGRVQVIQADDDRALGVQIMQYRTNLGEFNLVVHNLLEGATYGGMAIAIDFDLDPPKLRPLGGGEGPSRDTHVRKNAQEPDRDGVRDVIETELGFEWPLVKRHGVLTGVTG